MKIMSGIFPCVSYLTNEWIAIVLNT